jgi:2-methylcitrate dehydratase PrpD
MTQGLTHALGEFVARRIEPSADAMRIARSGFIDTVATMTAGSAEPVVTAVRALVRDRRSAVAEASILLGGELAASADAALINGTSAHALDYDDVALGGHPSTVLVPAILAEAESLGVSGVDVMHAYIVGYEVWAELAARDPDPYHEKGWHPTATLGTIGAAAAVAHLHHLPVDACRNAIALAASMASGLVANFGTMTKPLHAGRAAASGIDAVRLTRLGLTASPDALEHHAGFLAALSPRGRANRSDPVGGNGNRLRIVDSGLSIKRYPMCYAAHRAIDGVLDLVAANDLDADDVVEARVTIGATQASMLRNHAPANALEAKFSIEFGVASALVARSVGLRELTVEFVRRARVQRAMTKVRMQTVDTRCPIEPVFALADRVVLELGSGRTLDSGEIRFARGNAKLPLAASDLEAKFFECAGTGDNAVRIYRLLSGLDSLENVRCLRKVD